MRYSRDERQAHIELWRESGLSRAAYCRKAPDRPQSRTAAHCQRVLAINHGWPLFDGDLANLRHPQEEQRHLLVDFAETVARQLVLSEEPAVAYKEIRDLDGASVSPGACCRPMPTGI